MKRNARSSTDIRRKKIFNSFVEQKCLWSVCISIITLSNHLLDHSMKRSVLTMRSFPFSWLCCEERWLLYSLLLNVVIVVLLNISWFWWKRWKGSVLPFIFCQSISVCNSIFQDFLFFVVMNKIVFGTLSTCTERSTWNVTFIMTEIFFWPEY